MTVPTRADAGARARGGVRILMTRRLTHSLTESGSPAAAAARVTHSEYYMMMIIIMI